MPVDIYLEQLKQKISLSVISKVFKKIEGLPDIKCYRKELLWDLCEALEYAEHRVTTVYEAMKEIRNRK